MAADTKAFVMGTKAFKAGKPKAPIYDDAIMTYTKITLKGRDHDEIINAYSYWTMGYESAMKKAGEENVRK